MPAPPLKTAISGTPTNTQANTGFAALWDYVTGLLGLTGNAADARTALGLGSAAVEAAASFATAAQGATADSALQPATIGVSVQAYDVDTAKLDVQQTFTATQVADNDTAAVSTTSSYVFDGAAQIREITLTNNITVTFGAPTGIVAKAMYKFLLKAGDTNARAFAWNAAYKFPSANPPLTAGTNANGAYDVITFIGGAGNTLIYDGHLSDLR